MPTNEERMKALKARVAANQKRLAGLKTVQKLNQSIKADAEKLAALEANEAKKAANQRRKDDKHIKIVLGAGVMLLPASFQVQTIHAIMERLGQRDRESVEKWCAKRSLDLDALSPTEARDLTPGSSPLGGAVVRVIIGLEQGAFEWLTSELMARTTGKDREVVEQLIASRS